MGYRKTVSLKPNTKVVSLKNKLWERACSRRGQHIQPLRPLLHRHRERARSHRIVWQTKVP
ncbi:hypothetical protein FHJ31_09335 [Pseudomonas sp. Fig-3]|nr:hypothetical protein FHJ31_09335 [Pseudomonas sp. Fig-3]